MGPADTPYLDHIAAAGTSEAPADNILDFVDSPAVEDILDSGGSFGMVVGRAVGLEADSLDFGHMGMHFADMARHRSSRCRSVAVVYVQEAEMIRRYHRQEVVLHLASPCWTWVQMASSVYIRIKQFNV